MNCMLQCLYGKHWSNEANSFMTCVKCFSFSCPTLHQYCVSTLSVSTVFVFFFVLQCFMNSWCIAWTASAETAKQAVLWCASSSFPFHASLSVTIPCLPTVSTQCLFLCVCSVSWTLFCNVWATPGRCWSGAWMTATSWTSTPPPAAWRAVLSRVGLLQLSWVINVYGVCTWPWGFVLVFFVGILLLLVFLIVPFCCSCWSFVQLWVIR